MKPNFSILIVFANLFVASLAYQSENKFEAKSKLLTALEPGKPLLIGAGDVNPCGENGEQFMIERESEDDYQLMPDQSYCICNKGESYGKSCDLAVMNPCFRTFENRKGLELLDFFSVDSLSGIRDVDHLFIKCLNLFPQIYETRRYTRWCQSFGHIGESDICPEGA